jgi:transposase
MKWPWVVFVDTPDGAKCAEEFTMAQRRRPTYTPEFKAEAVRLVRTSLDPLTKIARDLGVGPATLRLWANATRPQPDVPLTDDERSELRRLRRENRELRLERDILKKATAFFAKHSE